MGIFVCIAIEIELSEDDYRETEGSNAVVEVRVAKDSRLANPVRFKVTPLTLDQARAQGLTLSGLPDDSITSPIAASMDKNSQKKDLNQAILMTP